MRRTIAIILAGSALAACARASAAFPDSHNPAHCYAAFNYAAYWMGRGDKYPEKVTQMWARAIFEAKKAQSTGESTKALYDEAAALTKANAKDLDGMDALVVDCMNAQNSDPIFRGAWPRLMQAARKAQSLGT
jgi:hypothetical protein